MRMRGGKMRKKLNVLFIVAMICMLVACLVACNKGVQDLSKLPDEFGGNESEFVYKDAYLKFSFPKQPSSVFSSIYVDEFDISDVIYSIVYTDGKTTTEVNGGSVTEEMVVEDDRPLLSSVGHHMIHVSTTLADGKTATGSFALHLKDHSLAVDRVTWKFLLGDSGSGGFATAYFGSVQQNVATIEIDKGIVFSSWDEFISEFKMRLSGRALVALKYEGGRLSPTQGFDGGFVVEKDLEFSGEWTNDIINVSFDLNLPSDATVIDGVPQDPRLTFETSQTVPRNIGRISAPKTDTFNVFNGYYFAGWYENDGDGNLDNDKLWNFSHTVGTTDISLYAKWTERAYSITIYTMGGVFKSDVTNSYHGTYPIDSAEKAIEYGYKAIPSVSRFSTMTGDINRIVLTGFKYGDRYDQYVAKIDVGQKDENGAQKYVFLKVQEILQNLTKGGTFVRTDGIYSDSQCTIPVANKTTVESDGAGGFYDIVYIKWVFNAPEIEEGEQQSEYETRVHIRYSQYLVNVVFKDSITLKSDGTLRLDKVVDDSINELKIPDKIRFNGADHYVTEIGEKAAMDLKTLSKLDLREASHLTKIGAEAFSHCPALQDVIMPINNNIETVGRNTFFKTNFENNYSKNNGGLQFIVINKTLYDYVGAENIDPKSITSLDLSVGAYYTEANCSLTQEQMDEANAQLASVNRIGAGAFELLTNLEEIKLGDNVEFIDNYAFVNLKSFKNIIVNETAKLSYIGERAFDENAPIFTAESPLFTNDAVIIGKTYYRYVDRTATEATIPAYIKYIAPEAFIGCVNMTNISFLNSNNIEGIGKDAFFSTKWIQKDDGTYIINGFVIINGIVAEYFGNNFNGEKADIVVPQNASRIEPYAFDSFSQDVKTIQIHDGITKIGDYAFYGAISLESIIFGDVAVENNRLVGAPSISDKSFLNQNDVIAFGLHLYFREEVIDLLYKLSTAGNFDAIADPITRQWANLYSTNSSIFIVEKVSNVWIDKEVISTNLLQTTSGRMAYFDKYGDGTIPNALVVISNTGVTQKQDLNPIDNELEFVLITNKENDEYRTYYEEGKTKYVVKFTYHGSKEGCTLTAGEENLFVFESTKAIMNAPKFYSSTLYESDRNVIPVDGYNEGANNYWIEGFDGQVSGSSVPTFYTSNTGVNVKFCYKDIDGNKCEMPLRILSFSTNVEKTMDKAIFAVDFNGLGEYRFSINYSVVKSLFNEIKQSSSISIPLNGDPVIHFNRYQVELIGQDGSSKPVSLNVSNFNVIKVDGVPSQRVNTTVIGRHTMTIQYTKDDAESVLEKQVIYTVVLDADSTIFQYEVLNDRTKTAKIVGVSLTARTADTLVLPETCQINGTDYTVVEIADNVFQNFQYLRSVYLSTTIRKIGKFAFANCPILENVLMVDIVGAQFIEIPQDLFEDVRTISQTDTTIIKEVRLTTLKGVDVGELTAVKVRASYTYKDKTTGMTTICNIVQANRTIAVDNDLNAVKVYMPDTIYNEYFMLYNDVESEPEIYHGEFVFEPKNNLPSALMSIGNSAFSDCTFLKTIEISKCNNLEYIGVSAFSKSGLESIALPNNANLTVINNQCFENCASLKTVTMYDNIQVLAAGCFNDCISLEHINTISTKDGVETLLVDTLCCQTIENGVFNNCSNLTEITLTADVTMVGDSVFSSCNALVIYCETTESNTSSWKASWAGQRPVVWDCKNNNIADDGETVYVFEEGICYSYKVGQTGELIATVARQRSGLTTATIKSQITGKDGNTYTVKSIGDSAFMNCSRLESVTVPTSIERIESDAFRNCISLTTFKFEGGNSLTYINSSAFAGCSDTFVPPTIQS